MGCRGADGLPAMANGKRITREKANVFHNLTPSVNSTSGGQLESWGMRDDGSSLFPLLVVGWLPAAYSAPSSLAPTTIQSPPSFSLLHGGETR